MALWVSQLPIAHVPKVGVYSTLGVVLNPLLEDISHK